MLAVYMYTNKSRDTSFPIIKPKDLTFLELVSEVVVWDPFRVDLH